MSEAPQRERIALPNRQQLDAIDDVDALEALREDIERAVTKMETDLDFADEEDDWFRRAKNALSHHRYVLKLIGRRIYTLTKPKPVTPPPRGVRGPHSRRSRPHSDAVRELFKEQYPNVELLTDLTSADLALETLTQLIHAVGREREDEITTYEPGARDETWLFKTDGVLKRANLVRNEITRRIGDLKKAARTVGEKRREERFVEACRRTLPKELYLQLWAAVDREEAEHLLGKEGQ